MPAGAPTADPDPEPSAADAAGAPPPGQVRPVRWVGVPAEDRPARRRTLLVDAAFDLLGTEGWAATTVRAVCARAQLNPRYFYESFPSLDDLVVAVYDRVVEELTAAVMGALADVGDDPAEHARVALGTIVGFMDEDRRRARVLYVEALGNEALNRRRIETGHALVEAVERDAIARRGAPPPGERVGRLAAAVLVGGLHEMLVGWLDGRIDVTREQLVEDGTVLFLALGDAAAGLAAARSGRPGHSGGAQRSHSG